MDGWMTGLVDHDSNVATASRTYALAARVAVSSNWASSEWPHQLRLASVCYLVFWSFVLFVSDDKCSWRSNWSHLGLASPSRVPLRRSVVHWEATRCKMAAVVLVFSAVRRTTAAQSRTGSRGRRRHFATSSKSSDHSESNWLHYIKLRYVTFVCITTCVYSWSSGRSDDVIIV